MRAQTNKLFYIDEDIREIRTINTNGTADEVFFKETEALSVRYLAASNSTQELFFTSGTPYKIYKKRFDGTLEQELYQSSGNSIYSIAVDESNNKIYWAESQEIKRANLDGSSVETVLGPSADVFYRSLTISGSKLYWAERSYNAATLVNTYNLKKSNLDGSSVEILDSEAVGNAATPVRLGTIYSMAVDETNGHLYWASYVADAIFRKNVDGSGSVTTILDNTYVRSPRGLVLDIPNNKLFWTDSDPSFDNLRSADLNGSNITLLSSAPSNPYGLVLATVNVSPLGSPEIDIQGNSKSIVNNDASPATSDYTDFGSVPLNNNHVDHYFFIRNLGGTNLNLTGSPKVSITGPNAGDFTLQTDAAGTISGTGSSFFVIRFDPSVLGTRTANVTITSNDSNEGTYSFVIQGTGDASSGETGTNDVRLTTHATGVSLDNEDPDVAYDPVSNRYLMVYEAEVVNLEEEIFGQFVSATGALIGSPFQISLTGTNGNADIDATNPRIVFNQVSNQYLVVWEADLDATSVVEKEIFGQLIDSDGTLVGGLGTGQFQLSKHGVDGDENYNATNAELTVNTSNGEYYVVWQAQTTITTNTAGFTFGDEEEAFGVRVQSNGTLVAGLGNQTKLSNFPDPTVDDDQNIAIPDVIYNPISNQYLVVYYVDYPTDGDYNIFGQIVSSTGTPISGINTPIQITSITPGTSRDANYTRVIHNPLLNEYLVGYQTDHNVTDSEDEIFGQRISNTGSLVGSPIQLSYAGTDGDGEKTGAYFSFGYNTTNDQILVLFQSEEPGSQAYDIFAATLSASDYSFLETQSRVSDMGNLNGDDNFTAQKPRADYNSTVNNFLVVWEGDDEAPNGSGNGEDEIFGQLWQSPPVAEIDIKGNSVSITDGDAIPGTGDFTDFGAVNISSDLARTFTVYNLSGGQLLLNGSPVVAISGTNAADFEVTLAPSSVISGNSSSDFEITFTPGGTGLRTADISIANNDAGENPYNFKIQGTGIASLPEINLKGNGVDIADGDTSPSVTDSTHFGNVNFMAGSNTNTFTIENTGAGTLQLIGTPKVTISGTDASSFTVVTQPAASIASSGSSEFQISFDPDSQGIKEAVVTISSNDADEGSFGFIISGIGLELKELGFCQDFENFTNCATTGDCEAVVCDLIEGWTNDNSDQIDWRVNSGPTPSEDTGPETDYSEGTSSGKYLYLEPSGCIPGRSGSLLSPIIDLSDALSPQLSFAYFMYGAQVDSLAIDISSDGGLSFVNNFWTKSGDQGNSWFTEEISLSSFIGDSIVVRFRGNTGSAFRSDIALDYICISEASPLAIYGNNILIQDGDLTPSLTDSTDFGTINIYNGNNTNNFYIKNLTSQSLTTNSLFITGANASDFILTQPSTSVISANDSVLFQIRFETTNSGSKTALVNILYSGENYSFQIQGTGGTSCTQVATSTELMTWNGSADTAWDNACNWSPIGVPTATNDVTIPSGPGNQPTIVVNSAVAKSVEVQSGATLTIASTGQLTINNSKQFTVSTTIETTAFLNLGTVQNNGKIVLGNTGAVGAYGLWNVATFHNNTNAQISIDRTTLAGLCNFTGGTFTNIAEIQIGSIASVGTYGLYNDAGFNNNAESVLTIDRTTDYGLWNNSGTFTNAAEIRIGSNASVGTYGLYNHADFKNNAESVLSIDRSSSRGLWNNSGTLTNAAEIRIGSIASVGNYGLFNEADFNNNAESVLSIDRTTDYGIWSNSGTITNAAEIQIGSIASVGATGLHNRAIFNNNAGGVLSIDNSTLNGLFNFVGATFTNLAEVRIGSNASVGAGCLRNEGIFNNNAGGVLSIDNSTGVGLWNASGTFTNISEIRIGSNSSIGEGSLYNEADFSNNAGGMISIDNSNNYGLLNNSGTFTNAAEIRIGSITSVGTTGLQNKSIFNNNAGGVISIDNATTSGLLNNLGTLTNAAEIRIGSIASAGTRGLENSSIFNNNAGGVVSINNSTSIGLLNSAGGTFTNISEIRVGSISSVGTYGVYNGANFNNNGGGLLSIDRTVDYGLFNVLGTFTNASQIHIGSNASVGSTGLWNSAIFENIICGRIFLEQGMLDNRSGNTYTNAGYSFVANELLNNGTFTNNGVLKYGSTTGNAIVNSTNPSVIVNNTPTPVFTYGGTYNGTIDGIFKSDSVTSAGTFVGPNTFTPNGSLSSGSQTLLAKITPNGGGCTYFVPFTYVYCNNSATISYAGTPFCSSAGPAEVTFSGTTGGGFTSSPAGLSLNSSTGEITPSGSTSGTYTVTYTIAAGGGCPSAVATTSVTITDNPSATISYAGTPYCSSTSPAAVTLTGTTGGAFTSAPAGLSINGTTGQITPSSSTAGTYTVTYTIAASGGCSSVVATTSVVINENDNANFSYGAPSYCVNASDPTPTITGLSGGTFSASPAGLSINSGTGQIDISSSTPNSYTVTYTTAGTCSNSSSVSISINSLPSVTISGTDNLTCAMNTVTRTASGGDYYSWSGPGTYSASTDVVSLTTPGTYTVTVTGFNGCSATETTIVTLDNTTPSPSISGSANLTCSTTSVTRSASGGTSYSWSGPNSFSVSTAIATITASGTYTVTVSNANGCSAQTTTVVTQDITAPTPSVSGSANLTCSTTSVTRTASGGTSYLWSGPNSFSASAAIATITAPGTYTVTVSNANGCSAQTTTVVTQDITVPTPSVSGSANLTCSTTSVTRTASGGTSYSWSGPNSFSASTAIATISAPGTYTVTVSNANGCSAQTTTVVTQDITVPTPSVAGSDNLTCSTTSVTRTASGGTSYSWTGPNSFSVNTAIATITAPGTYTVTVSNANGCSAQTTTVVTQDITVPTTEVSGSDNLTCSTTSVTRTASGGTSYSWSGPNSFSASTAIATISAPGTYTVTVSNANGCSAQTTTVVTQDITVPTPSVTGSANLTCSTTSVTRSASGGTSYSWSGPNSFSASTAVATISAPGTYTVTVSNANGCSAQTTTVVTQDITVPTPEVSGSDNLTCLVTSVTRTASGGTLYSWSGPNSFSASTAVATISAPGTYTVTVSNANGCSAQTTTVATQDITVPTPSVTGSANLTCSTTSVTRTASGGTSYSWSGPNSFSASTAVATISAPGTYTVTVSNANGCSAQTTTVVTQDITVPTPSVTGSANLTCSTTSVTRTASGGTSYLWSGPNSFSANTAIATITAPGTYTVTVSNANGCSAQTTTVVTQDITVPTPAVSGSANLTCSTTSVTRTASGGTSYSWTGPNSFSSSTAIATISAPGTYTVTVSNANGCSAQTTTVVTQDITVPTPSFTGSANLTCSTTSVTRTASGGISYFWSGPNSFSASTAIATISAPGTYTVTVSNANGCSAQTTTVVTQDITVPTPSVSGSANLTCSTTSVTRTASGGTSYSWSGPNSFSASTATATITASGTYTVTVTAANSCSATATTEVSEASAQIIASASNSGPYQESHLIQLMASGGTSYSWSGPGGFSSSLQNPSIPNATIGMSGIYTVTVSSAGCSATATTEVAVACLNPGMDYYLAYTEPTLEIIAPLAENLQVQRSDRKMTIIAITTCENPKIESVKLQLSGTTNIQYTEDNNMPFELHEVNGLPSGDVLQANLYTFIARGYSEDNAQGDVLVGPDVFQFWIVNGTQTLTEPVASTTSICVGSSLTVSTTASGTFEPGNSYQVYLSDANGSFGNATLIGTSTSPNNISCTLPNYLKSSDLYKIKVTSTAPVVTSVISSYTLSIISSDVVLSSPIDDIASGIKIQKAINTIKATNSLTGTSNSSYMSGKSVSLEPGFQADGGTVFKAQIQSVCPD